ncbi:MAG: STAS domain-containing protein [Clostridia bacterium]|nr:STAS domain-containing protein [Clostridia bacterium]
MKIDRIEDAGNITLKIEGWLDTNTSPELGAKVDEIKEAKSITLDFDLVEYMSSAGLRQVVATYKLAKELGADFKVINTGKEVFNIFSLTGIDKKINITTKE